MPLGWGILTVSSDPVGLARWAIVSENMELINLVLTVWVGGSILFSVVWLLSLE
jgi:hypothetical protein